MALRVGNRSAVSTDTDTESKTKQQSSSITKADLSGTFQRILIIIVVLIVLFGIGNAISKAWLSDDAFISFRYAKNLSDGLGLVYNSGERVEGYTNFLWTALLSGGMELGYTPEITAKVMGLLSFVALSGLLLWHSARRQRLSQTAFLPLAALAVLLNRDMQVFATGGLETAMFTALVFAGYAVIIWRSGPLSLQLAGILFTGAALTRPDGLIIYASAIGYILLSSNLGQGSRFKSTFRLVAPAVAIYLPYFLLRWNYYGQLLPNTFYAKSGSLSYYGQGLIYLWLFLKTYYLFLAIPLVFLGGLYLLKRLRAKQFSAESHSEHRDPDSAHKVLFALALALPYMLAVVRVGGDFMFARFFIPIVPLLYIAFEEALAGVSLSYKTKLAITGFALLTVVLRYDQYSAKALSIAGIADESRYYPAAFVEQQKQLGGAASDILNKAEATVSFKGANAMLVYYANPKVAIEAESGLTDSSLAHQVLQTRGRPGHEKSASLEYLQRRRVNLQFEVGLDFEKTRDELHYLQIGDLIAYLVGYDIKVMNVLKQNPGVRFVDFPKYLDNYINNMSTKSLATIRSDYAEFKRFYFDYNSAFAQERPFLERLNTTRLVEAEATPAVSAGSSMSP